MAGRYGHMSTEIFVDWRRKELDNLKNNNLVEIGKGNTQSVDSVSEITKGISDVVLRV